MISLYKYMPMSSLLQFMQDPCLRLTPSNCQNDPFEFGFTKRDIDALNAIAPNKQLGTNIENFAKRHGVISLSSDYRDVCMWAHYADSHRGAVVEICVDEINPQSAFWFPNFIKGRQCSDLLFNKVNYSTSRSLEAPREMTSQQIRHHYYFTKFERWSSEEEYRFIVPFDVVDKIICTALAVKHLHNHTKCDCSIFRQVGDGNAIRYVLEGVELQHMTMSEEGVSILEMLWAESKGTDVMFFSRLAQGVPGKSAGSIGQIYFGLNSDLTDFMDKLEDRSVDSIYGNYVQMINGDLRSLFKAIPDDDSYNFHFDALSRDSQFVV